MTMNVWIMRAVATAMLLGTAPAAMAQESTNLVVTATDWSVFEDPPICGNEKEGEKCRKPDEKPEYCWGSTRPKQSVNTRDGQQVSVRRGEIMLFVTFWIGKPGEVSFIGGYPFAAGSTVAVNVDGSNFELFTDGEWAWPGTPQDDDKILTALKKGSTAVMTAQSSKGTQTVDTFSLRGFTAAMTEAGNRCK
jgi:hypothetical protein